ncbi:hypothetical protein F4560_006378 [Saccharothrix ecbatanensis]|uniref:Uncharacterized protein n=1 Tax=Saccharothrix ecbatanensis TaxID=1105145 RepID=A0A7W9HQM3_9PSEU|nr:hypothetical protein [Saccharothrix ecbatanensis]MBB5806610.1 hypothetical protein [Saccharothrix ecbatanensis]
MVARVFEGCLAGGLQAEVGVFVVAEVELGSRQVDEVVRAAFGG